VVSWIVEFLELIAKFFEHLTAWLPRPFLVNVTERGVRFRRGQEAKLVKPGLRAKVPLSSTVEVFSLLKDATRFEPTTLMTKGDKEVSIGWTCIWAVEDPILAATTTDDLTAMVEEVGESILPPVVMNYTVEELRDAVANVNGREWSVNRRLTTEAQKVLTDYGVRVHQARVNFIARTRVFKLLQPKPTAVAHA
jgi:hypothetical protein